MSADTGTQPGPEPTQPQVSDPVVDPGAQQPSQLQTPGEGATLPVEGQPTDQQPPEGEAVQAEFVPRSVLEHEVRKVQSAKDREIAELNQRLVDQSANVQHPQQPVGQQPQTDEFSQDVFNEYAKTDGEKAVNYMRETMTNEILSKVNAQNSQQQQEQAYLNQYASDFRALADKHNLTPDQRQRAEEAAVGNSADGMPVMSVFEAMAIGMGGDQATVLGYAQQMMQQQQQQLAPVPNAQQPGPNGLPPRMPGSRANAPVQGQAQTGPVTGGQAYKGSIADWH